uniref:Uncharacterized protein n=1 Tax=Tanacetum cinerariifolium TaxID=118510 RepID=A0A699I610_TANCI|nr:hypothetical protein [Tanacetum cinerariifolium]
MSSLSQFPATGRPPAAAGQPPPATTPPSPEKFSGERFRPRPKRFPTLRSTRSTKPLPPHAPLHPAATAAAITTATSSSSPHTASPTADTHKILSTTTATRLPRRCPTATAVHH